MARVKRIAGIACRFCGGSVMLDRESGWGGKRARCLQCGREPGRKKAATAPAPLTQAEQSGLDGLGRGYRLPTQAEIKAARLSTMQGKLFCEVA